MEVGLQLVLSKNKSTKTLYLAFSSPQERDDVYSQVVSYLPGACKTE